MKARRQSRKTQKASSSVPPRESQNANSSVNAGQTGRGHPLLVHELRKSVLYLSNEDRIPALTRESKEEEKEEYSYDHRAKVLFFARLLEKQDERYARVDTWSIGSIAFDSIYVLFAARPG